MLYGMLESQSVHLSDISRALKEKITLKKTIDRLSRNLNCFNEKFIIRAKKNRNVKYKGKTINILELANKHKGRYAMQFKNKYIAFYKS